MNAFSFARSLLPALLLPFLLPLVHGEIPEPDNLVYGTIMLGTNQVTAADTGISVEARRTPTSPAIAGYQMGANPSAGDFYSLHISLESLPPITDPSACETDTLLYLVVTDSTGVRDQKTFIVGDRGQVTRLDFGWIDTDDNGLNDEWERQFFGQLGIDPYADPDSDGRNNLIEAQAGTNPLLADTPHPADRSPCDYAIDIDELTTFALAWKTGQPWPEEPTNIPLDYVTRAGYLWKNGEHYLQDLVMASSPPLWWTNIVSSAPLNSVGQALPSLSAFSLNRSSAGSTPTALVAQPPLRHPDTSNQVNCSLPPVFNPGEPVRITLAMQPESGATAYGLEAQVPFDWQIMAISDDGQFDATNQKIKWGLFFDPAGTTVSCELIPTATEDEVSFTGTGSFDGVSAPIAGQPSMLRAGLIKFLTLSGSADRGFQARLRAEPDKDYVIEMSVDLAHWEILARVRTSTDGTIEFMDGYPGGTRFYRARTVSP
ncbi:MAG: hypothetical protein M1608_18140 [Candidatus Omnitrophica bacterium]|nr:hypothetical protein [Candidatus Omnitrophota bacterium]